MICGGTGEAKEATAEVQELVNGLRAELEKEVSGNMAPGNLEATHFKTQVWRKHLEPWQNGFTRLNFRLWRGRIILSASATHPEVTSTSGLIIGGNLGIKSD